eukprot:scaffold142593_cov20-Tisochrysis_lutea.AAC.1
MHVFKVRVFTACRGAPALPLRLSFCVMLLIRMNACAQSEGIHSMPRSPCPSPPLVFLCFVTSHLRMCALEARACTPRPEDPPLPLRLSFPCAGQSPEACPHCHQQQQELRPRTHGRQLWRQSSSAAEAL